MYQSFPQNRFYRSGSAMPVIKQHPLVCDDKKNCENQEKCEKKDEKKEISLHKDEKCENYEKCEKNGIEGIFGDLFKKFELDDLILIGLILFLLYEGEDNFITIGILLLVLFL